MSCCHQPVSRYRRQRQPNWLRQKRRALPGCKSSGSGGRLSLGSDRAGAEPGRGSNHPAAQHAKPEPARPANRRRRRPSAGLAPHTPPRGFAPRPVFHLPGLEDVDRPANDCRRRGQSSAFPGDDRIWQEPFEKERAVADDREDADASGIREERAGPWPGRFGVPPEVKRPCLNGPGRRAREISRELVAPQ